MIRFTKRQFYLFLGIFLLLFPSFNAALLPVLLPPRLRHFVYFIGLAFIYAYQNKGTVVQCKKEILFLLLAAFFLIYWRSAMPNDLNRFEFAYLSLFGSMLLLHLDDRWWGIFWRVVRIFAVFHLVTGVLLLLMRDFQVNYVVPLVTTTEQSKKVLLLQIGNRYMTGLTYHYSTMGMYMAAGVISCSKPLLAKGEKVKLLDLVLFAAMVVGVILTAKRAHVLFSAMALVFIYWLINRPFTVRQYRQAFMLLLIFTIATVILYFTVPQFQTLIGRFLASSDDINDMSSGRVGYYWLSAILLFTEKPLLGYGWRSFRVINTSRFGMTSANDAHNIYIQLAAETGVVGLAVFLTIFVGSFILAYKAYKMQNKMKRLSTDQQTALALAMAYQVFFLLYGFTGNPLYDAQCYVPYFLCCTIGYSAWYRLRHEQKMMMRMKIAGVK